MSVLVPRPYDRVQFRGVILNRRTKRMFLRLEKRCKKRGVTGLVVAQGSYNRGVKASAGTHDGGGSIDIACDNLTDAEERIVVKQGRLVGFAMWLRLEDEGPWSRHIHGEAIGDDELSAGAAEQVRAYDRGRNGLANNALDRDPYRPPGGRKWAWVRNRPVARW